MQRSQIIRSKSKKASQQQWMDIWMGKGQEFEHEAFLCLWLSRLMRWNKVKISTKCDVSLALDSARDDFRWRPYTKPLNNWSFDSDLQSYVRCIRVSQLVGLDCIESYFPHRVAMQFGLDQDIPIACLHLSDTNESAWRNYNRPIGDIKLYIPPKHSEVNITTRYLEWWKKSKVMKESSSFEIEKEDNLKMSMEMEERLKIKIENNEADVPPGFSPNEKRVAEKADESSQDNQPSAKDSNVLQIFLFLISRAVIFMLLGYLYPRDTSAATYHQHVLPSEKCTRQDMSIEDRAESKASSPIRSPISIDKKNVQASFNGAHQSSDIDLLDRIARLQRIIDFMKAAKISQTYRQYE
ncbi:Serine/threonine-protein phosphatase 7 long form-like protein [Bienertia sinuspersici]